MIYWKQQLHIFNMITSLRAWKKYHSKITPHQRNNNKWPIIKSRKMNDNIYSITTLSNLRIYACITGLASLAFRSTPEPAKPVPPCQRTNTVTPLSEFSIENYILYIVWQDKFRFKELNKKCTKMCPTWGIDI